MLRGDSAILVKDRERLVGPKNGHVDCLLLMDGGKEKTFIKVFRPDGSQRPTTVHPAVACMAPKTIECLGVSPNDMVEKVSYETGDLIVRAHVKNGKASFSWAVNVNGEEVKHKPISPFEIASPKPTKAQEDAATRYEEKVMTLGFIPEVSKG